MNQIHYPDPAWTEIDEAGHEHRFAGDELPTLKVIVAGHRWCDECGQSQEHNVYACLKCGKKVEPHFTHEFVKPLEPELSEPEVYPTAPSYVAPPIYPPSPLGPISEISIEARRDEEEIVSFSSSGAREYYPGTPRYTLIINGTTEIPLTEIEVQVAAETAKHGHGAMLEFAQSIIRDRSKT